MLVRVAQGLTHMGKGTMTLNPFHSDRQLMCPAAVAALFATCFAFLDAEHSKIFCKIERMIYVWAEPEFQFSTFLFQIMFSYFRCNLNCLI